MNKIDALTTSSHVFVSRIQFKMYPNARERLQTFTDNIIWDENQQGAWIRRGSTAHNLAILLGIEPYDIKLKHQDGTYDRHGKIS